MTFRGRALLTLDGLFSSWESVVSLALLRLEEWVAPLLLSLNSAHGERSAVREWPGAQNAVDVQMTEALMFPALYSSMLCSV